MLWFVVKTIVVGFFSGYLSGQLGVGGGALTTPAIRIFLLYPAAIAVGTPLAVIIPTAITGGVRYARSGLVDWQLARRVSTSGMVGVLSGAYATKFVSAHLIMIITAVVLLGLGVRMAVRGREEREKGAVSGREIGTIGTYALGLLAGLFSGFLGLGGGVVMVPAFVGPLGRNIKCAFGTSLVVMSVFAIPGSIVHYSLGHVDVRLALLLIVGVIPGAWVGSRIAIRAPDVVLRLAFASFLAILAIALGAGEITRMLP